MAVKKATSVAKRDVPPKKAAQTKAVATKAAAKTTTKASATKAAEGRKARVAESSASPTAQPQRLRVRENEKPWTVKELATVRAALEADIVRLQSEISAAELALAGLMLDAGGGAGDDQADACANLQADQPLEVMGTELQLNLTRNSGAAYSIATGATWVLAAIAC